MNEDRSSRVGHNISEAQEGMTNGYSVQAPRASDAIGLALRDAYSREPELPADMTEMLRRLYRYGERTR
jgi:hypothetical protein